MRFGLCTNAETAPLALAAGFDYVELAAVSFTMVEDFDPKTFRALGIEASNVFFPSGMSLFSNSDDGPDEDPVLRCTRYAREAVARASEIGIDTMVIGSGAARTAPASVPLDIANQTFVNFSATVQGFARDSWMTIAPESLSRLETNVGTDLGQLADMLQEVGVGFTADSHHILYEWSADGGAGIPDDSLWEAQLPYRPMHVHLGDLARVAPWDGDEALRGFVRRLQRLGYDGRVSLESRLRDTEPDTLLQILNQIKALFG